MNSSNQNPDKTRKPKVDFQTEFFVQIPNYLFYDLANKNISKRDFIVYAALQKFRDRSGKKPTTPSNSQIAALTNLSNSSVVEALKQLEKTGYIMRTNLVYQSGEQRRQFKFLVRVEKSKIVGCPATYPADHESTLDSVLESVRHQKR